MAEEPLGDDTRTPSGESDIVDEWIGALKDSLEDGPVPVTDAEMANLEEAIMEQIADLSNETIAQQLEYHSMVLAFATMAGDIPLAEAAQQNVELWEMCAARKGFEQQWEAEGNVTFAAEYGRTGTLSNLFNFSSGDTEALSGFTPEELATSSAIHGDFNQASLGYSGHQNLELRGEGITFEGETYFEAPMDVFQPGRADVENSVSACIRHANSATGKSWSLYTPYKPKYYIHTSDQGQVKGQKGVSNKFIVFLIVKEDGVDNYRAYNAYARIGYTPGRNQVKVNYRGNSLSYAEQSNQKKINTKTRASRSKGTYVSRKYAEESKPNCGCGKDPCITYGAEAPKKAAEWVITNNANGETFTLDDKALYLHFGFVPMTASGPQLRRELQAMFDKAGVDVTVEGDDRKNPLPPEEIFYDAEQFELAHPYKTGFKMYLGALGGTALSVIGLLALGNLLTRNN